jgi:enterochelin esterase-like enzyme
MNRREYLVAAGTYATSLMLGGMAHAKLTAPLLRTGPQPPLQWVTPRAEGVGLSFHTFLSQAAGAKVSFHVYAPSAYTADPARRFPVVYWLHGSGGGVPGISRLSALADEAISAGKAPPFLMVFVNGLEMGMYIDWANGRAPLETVIIHELRPHIDANWRTIATREGRLLDGFSMGGYGAARFGFRYPELFQNVSMMGAGPMQETLDRTPRASSVQAKSLLRDVYGGKQARFLAVSPRRYAEQNATTLARGSRLRLVIGDRDETFDSNRNFHDHLMRLGIPHQWIVLPGIGHDPMGVLAAMGDQHWAFYRDAFAAVVV